MKLTNSICYFLRMKIFITLTNENNLLSQNQKDFEENVNTSQLSSIHGTRAMLENRNH